MKFENMNPWGSRKFPERCAMKMKERRKMTATQNIRERKDFIRLYQKIGWANFDELQDNDSTLNKGTNSRVNKRIGQEKWFIVRSRTMGTINLAMAGTQE